MTHKKKAADGGSTLLFILCFVAYSFSYIGRMNYSACMNSMITDGLFDKAFGGIIMTAYLVCYGGGQLINGIFGSKISPKYMIGTGLLGVGISNILMGVVGYKYLFFAVWALNGFFNSMLWAPIIRIFSEWLPDDKRYNAGLQISLTIPLGTVMSYLVTSLFLKISNWRIVFCVCGGLVLAAFSVWYLGMYRLRGYIQNALDTLALRRREYDEKVTAENDTDDAKDKNAVNKRLHPSVFTVFASTGLVFIMFAILFNGALKDAMISWVPSYICDAFGATDSAASLVSVILPLVSVCGAFVATTLNRKFFKNELLTSAAMFIISLASLVGAYLFSFCGMIVVTVFLAISVSSMWGVNTMLLTFVPYHFGRIGMSSTVSGILNCCAYIASSFCSYYYGVFSESFGWSNTVLLWCGLAVGGAVICAASSYTWKKHRSTYEV